MLNTNLISRALELMKQVEFSNQIYETTECMRSKLIDWYNHTDITDAETLAAVAISGSYSPIYDYSYVLEQKAYWFPEI